METVRATLTAAHASYYAGDLEGCRAALARGLAATEPHTPIATELRVLEQRLLLWTRPSVADAAAARADALRHGVALYDAEALYGTALYMDGRAEAISHLQRARTIAESKGTANERADACIMLASGFYSAYRADEAIEAALAAEAHAVRGGLVARAAEARWNRLRLEWLAKANYSRAEEFLGFLGTPLGLGNVPVRADVAMYLGDLGRHVEAGAILDSTPLVDLVPWSRGVMLLARAETEAAANRPGRAEPVATECTANAQPQLRAFGRLIQGWSAVSLGWAVLPAEEEAQHAFDAGTRPEARALVALTTPGEEKQAIELFTSAADIWSKVVVRLELRCRWGASEAMIRAGFGREGRAALKAAVARAREIGVASLASRMEVSNQPPARHAASLTPREREILVHVRQGATTGEIASELGISGSTVNRHVRNVVTKTGASTRRHAAALVSRGLITDVPGLTISQLSLMRLLGDGATIGDAARLLHVSRRTATRQLTDARLTMGLATNASAIAAVAGTRR